MNIPVKQWECLSKDEQERFLRRSETDISLVSDAVEKIVSTVRKKKDAALKEYTKTFDHVDMEGLGINVSEKEFVEAETMLSPRVKEALDYSMENVRAFHLRQKPEGMTFSEVRRGIFAGERATPVDSAGLYVPRGRGSFPSMLYMLAIPAGIAEVPRIVVATPPNPDGTVDPACLYAARKCGVHEVYRIGGAQAVAALAYGTESVPRVEKIIGPGSMYVAAAQRIVSPATDTGLPAGPSESIILADEHAAPRLVALDLLIEAEHGSDSSALLITPSKQLAEDVSRIVPVMTEELPEPRKTFVVDVFNGYGGIIVTRDNETAAELVNDFAPEHLQIQTSDPFRTLSLIRNAGEILLGSNTPFSAANYSTGPNAVLPTGGKAKTCSPVSVRDFIKYSSVVYLTPEGYNSVKGPVTTLADYEGFITHGNAFTHRV